MRDRALRFATVAALALAPACGSGGAGGGPPPAPPTPTITALTGALPPAGGTAIQVIGTGFPGANGDPVTVRLRSASGQPAVACGADSLGFVGTRSSATTVDTTSPTTNLLQDVAVVVEVELAGGTVATSSGAIATLAGAPDPARDQDGDAVPDACDSTTYDFQADAIGARPAGLERLGGATSSVTVRDLAGDRSAAFSAGTGHYERLVRCAGREAREDVAVYADVETANGGVASLELWSDGSWGDVAGAGVIVQVEAGGTLRFYTRLWQALATAAGPAIPASGRMRFRLVKGAGATSVLHVDAWTGTGWADDLATWAIVDDSTLRGVDVSMCDYIGGTRAWKRLSVVHPPRAGALHLFRDPTHAADWKVFQRSGAGAATIPLRFSYRLAAAGRAEAQVVVSATGLAFPGHGFADHGVSLAAAPTGAHASLDVGGVPTGGSYDVHLRLVAGGGTVLAQEALRDVAVGDVWLAGGQSNMSGYSGNLIGGEPAVDTAHLFHNDGRWKRAAEPMDDGADQTDPISYEAPLHSCMLAFASALSRATGVPVGVIPGPLGGTNLYAQWQRNAGQPPHRFTLYGSLLARAQRQALGSPVRGMIWFQGESDALAGRTTTQYAADLRVLRDAYRSDLASPTMAFLVGQLGTYASAPLDAWLHVQEAQRQVSLDALCGLATAVDLPRSDAIHFNVAGYRSLGRRFALEGQRVAHGQPVATTPKLVSVVAQASGTAVDVTFDVAVTGGAAALFSVRDASGNVGVSSVSVAGAVATLHLARTLAASPLATYGLSTDPLAAWLKDAQGIPAPCFREVAVGP